MNTFEMLRSMQKITPAVIRDLGIGSVLLHQQKVTNDLADANDIGLTFNGDRIDEVGRFSDWIETGQFRDSLRFADTQEIDLTSSGDGFEAIKANYSLADYIAPTAKVLSKQTMKSIKADFINNIKQQFK